MELNVTIKLETTPELLTTLSTVCETIESILKAKNGIMLTGTEVITKEVVKPVEPVNPVETKKEEPVKQAEAKEETLKPSETINPGKSIEELQLMCRPLCMAGKKEAIAGLCEEFGVQAITELKKEQTSAFAERVAELNKAFGLEA